MVTNDEKGNTGTCPLSIDKDERCNTGLYEATNSARDEVYNTGLYEAASNVITIREGKTGLHCEENEVYCTQPGG